MLSFQNTDWDRSIFVTAIELYVRLKALCLIESLFQYALLPIGVDDSTRIEWLIDA
jgi:hypothetical protein